MRGKLRSSEKHCFAQPDGVLLCDAMQPVDDPHCGNDNLCTRAQHFDFAIAVVRAGLLPVDFQLGGSDATTTDYRRPVPFVWKNLKRITLQHRHRQHRALHEE